MTNLKFFTCVCSGEGGKEEQEGPSVARGRDTASPHTGDVDCLRDQLEAQRNNKKQLHKMASGSSHRDITWPSNTVATKVHQCDRVNNKLTEENPLYGPIADACSYGIIKGFLCGDTLSTRPSSSSSAPRMLSLSQHYDDEVEQNEGPRNRVAVANRPCWASPLWPGGHGWWSSVALLLFLLASLSYPPSCASQSATSRHVVGAIPGDLVVGALFPVHHAPVLHQAHTRSCSEIREQYGIQRVEAAYFTIDKINSDDTILPNITLGIEIRDSCWYSPIALEQSIEFIRDAMAAGENGPQHQGSSDTGHMATPVPSSPRSSSANGSNPSSSSASPSSSILSSISHSPFFPLLKTPLTFGQFNASAFCPKTQKKVKNLVGVVGPAASSVTIQVQNLLQLFNIPQIGYSATSRHLSIKSYYKYFLRVVPSDLLQARVIVDLLKSHNWTYISVVYTDGNYGSSLMELFKNIGQDEGICIANTEQVFDNAEDEDYDNVLRNLLVYKSTARVVACFCQGVTVRNLLKSMRRLNAAGDLLLIGSDGWADRYDVVEDYEQEAVGGISVRIYSPYVHQFDPYYFNLKPDTNTRNPWFREFWEHKFNCTLPPKTVTSLTAPPASGSPSSSSSSSSSLSSSSSRDVAAAAIGGKIQIPVDAKFNRTCTGKESLSEKYKQDTKMAFVMTSILTAAHGLHNMQRDLCPGINGLCPAMLPVNGSLFLQYLMNVTFKWGNETISFDQYGDPPGRYDVMNFQKQDNGNYDYVQVGTWISTPTASGRDFNLFKPFQWLPKMIDTNSSSGIPESVCSKPCNKGHEKNIQSDSVKCCWVCVPCHRNQYLLDEYTCIDCPLGWWPDDELTGCVQIPVEYTLWSETPSLIAIGMALFGILITFFSMLVFIRHNNTSVVKASTRELSYLIMIGMLLSHGTTFALVAKPTRETCLVTRILPGLSFAIIYGSLVTKTNRIARILAGSKKKIMTKKLRFMSSSAQVVISVLIVLIEIAIVTAMLVQEPADSKLDHPKLDQVKLICNTTPLGILAPLGFDFFLILMCTVYAVKTRNVPENFNEAKFIGFSMYTTLVIWIAFVPIYFGSPYHKVLTMCLSISLSAIVALVLLFFPKLYIMIFKPEKNNRSFFTTAKNVRCHIGSHNGLRADSGSSNKNKAASASRQAVASTLKAGLGILGGFDDEPPSRRTLDEELPSRPSVDSRPPSFKDRVAFDEGSQRVLSWLETSSQVSSRRAFSIAPEPESLI
ncbi:Metabotropic glutamate receptor 5 [Halotydeus destructor]|nr:Metabotropic glutamate receptor 5 [Halotydeus destructor]